MAKSGFNRKNLGVYVAVGITFVLILGFVLNINQWVIKYAECGGAPIAIDNGFSGPTARLYPGDKSYGPDIFNSYECMTAEEKAGVRY